jgi:hypothetical protein
MENVGGLFVLAETFVEVYTFLSNAQRRFDQESYLHGNVFASSSPRNACM